MQVRCQGESTYILEEDIEKCFRTGRGLALTLGGPRSLTGIETQTSDRPDDATSGRENRCDPGP